MRVKKFRALACFLSLSLATGYELSLDRWLSRGKVGLMQLGRISGLVVEWQLYTGEVGMYIHGRVVHYKLDATEEAEQAS